MKQLFSNMIISTNRRGFLRTLILGGLALQLPFIFHCKSNDLQVITLTIRDKIFLINTEFLLNIMQILLPKTQQAPGANDLKSDIYYLWLLNDTHIEESRRAYLAEIVVQMEAYFVDKYKEDFSNLTLSEQNDAVSSLTKTKWGEGYLSSIMSIIIESMFANPIYNCNTDKAGWKWLNYQGGFPEPQMSNKYPEILTITQSRSIHEK